MANPTEVQDDFGGVPAHANEVQDGFGGVPAASGAATAPEPGLPPTPGGTAPEVLDYRAMRARARGAMALIGNIPESELPAETQDQERKGALLRWQAHHIELTPKDAATALRAAAATGYPVDLVAKDLPRFERELAARQTDWKALAAEHPALADFLLAEPARLAMAKDDVQNLSRLEYFVTGRWESLPAEEYAKLNPNDRAVQRLLEYGEDPTTPIHYLATPPVWVAQLRDALKQQRTIAAQNVYSLSAPDQMPRNEEELARERIRRGEERAFGVVVKEGSLGRQEEAAIRQSWADREQMKVLAEQPYIARIPTPEEAARFATLEPQPDAPWRATLRKRIEEWRQEENRDYGPWARSVLGRIVLGPFKLAPMIGGNVLAVAGGTAAGGPGGGFAAGVAWNSYQNFGPLAYEMQQATDANGNPVDPTKANALAGLASVGGGVLMQAGVGSIVNKLGGGRLLEDATVRAGTRLLVDQSLAQDLGQAAAHFGKDVATGAFAMGIQAGMNKGAEVLATGRGDAGDVERAIADATRQALPDLLLLSATASGRAMLAERGQRAAAAEGAARLAGTIQAAKASTTLARSPETFGELVQTLDPAGAVHIDVGAWDRYWQGKGIDPARAAAELLQDGGRGYGEAAVTRTDLRVPSDRYLRDFAKTEHAIALFPDSRLSLDVPTPRQALARVEPPQDVAGDELQRAAVREAEPASIPPAVLDLLNDVERSEYETTSSVARTEAEQDLLRRITENRARENQAWFRAERERLQGQVEAELDANLEHRAALFLRTGEMRGGPEAQAAAAFLRDEQGQPMKLDRRDLEARFGAEVVAELPRGIFAQERAQAAPLEDVASLLGFNSGEDLVQGLRGLPTRAAAVKAEVQRRLEATYGRLLVDNPNALAEAAVEAVHNEAGAKRALLELTALQRRLNPNAPAPVVQLETIRETARRMLTDRPQAEVQPGYFLQAERAAARRAFDFATAGDDRKALTEKFAQLLNQELYREARDLRQQLDSGLAMLRGSARSPWRAELGKADPIYRDAHDQVLEALELADLPTNGRPRHSLDELAAQADADFAVLSFDLEAVKQLVNAPRPWKALSVAEALNVVDAIRNIRHIANDRNVVEVLGRRQRRDDVCAQMRATAEKNLPRQPREPDDKRVGETLARGVRLLGQAYDGATIDMFTYAHMLDGANRDGIFHQVFIDGWRAARDREHAMLEEYLRKIDDAFERSGLDRARLYEPIQVGEDLPLPPELARLRSGEERTRANLLMMLAELGNDGNAERFLGGYGWSRDQVRGVVSKYLNAKEVRWVQDVWNSLEGLYPEIARVHEEETGLPPGKVQARSLKLRTSDGEDVELEGGYFPAKYDARAGSRTRVAQHAVEAEIADFFQPNYTRQLATARGHTKERAEHFRDIVNLDFGTVPTHVLQVVHDVAFRKYVKQTAALILDSRVETLLTERLGPERAKAFRDWLGGVANEVADTVPENLQRLDRAWSGLKSLAAKAALGYSVKRGVSDWVSDPWIAVSAGLVRPDYMARALLKQFSPTQRRFALESSGEVRARLRNISHRLRAEMGEMGGAAGRMNPVLRAARDSAYWTMEIVDQVVVPAIFTARYEQSRAEYVKQGLSPDAAHKRAVRDGEDVVAQVMPPHHAAEKPTLLRDRRGFASLVLFAGHANKMWQLFYRRPAADVARVWRSPEATAGDKAAVLGKFVGRILAGAIVNGVVAEYFAGSGQQEDEDRTDYLVRKTLSGAAYALPPGLGALAGMAINKLALGRQQRFSVRASPAAQFSTSVLERIGTMAEKGLAGDFEAGDAAAAAAEVLAAVAAGAPTRQAHETIGYIEAVAAGETVPRGTLDVLGGLIYGDHPGESNPLSDLQDLVEGE